MRFVLYLCSLCWSVGLLAQDQYTLQPNEDITINACNGTLFDSGGPDGDYENSETSTAIITSEDGDFIELTFSEFSVENNFDQLNIYAGTPQTGTLIGIYDGDALPNSGAPIVVNGNVATIVLETDFSIVRSGFAMDFTCGTVTAPPTAAFNTSAGTCSGFATFQDQSTGFATSWEWDFGDGGTSTAQNPVYQYTVAGTYDVSLTACNSTGCNTVTTTAAVIYDPEDELCSSGVNMPSQGEEIVFECQGVLFDPGGPDGNYANNEHSTFIIFAPGASNITVTFSEFNLTAGGEHTDFLYIYDAVNYTWLGSYQGNELPNDGAPITFNTSGIGVVLVTDGQNTASGFSLEWQGDGSSEAPLADFTTSNDNPALGVSVQYTDTSTNGPGQWEWDFGDGTTFEGLGQTSHTYDTPGTYTVSLTVANCNGSDVTTQTVTVQGAPDLTYDPESFSVTLDAGTTTSETLTVCNNGTGDLVVTPSITGEGQTTGTLTFTFVTNENGADFSWALLDSDLQVIEEGSGYNSNETVDVTFTNLDLDGQYYLGSYSPAGVQALTSFIWYDQEGNILYEGFYPTGPDVVYNLPPAFETTLPDWLILSEEGPVIAPGTCVEYTVDFDATELNGGVYQGTIILASNDPDQPTVTIPVTLTVIGIPAISISTNDLNFGEVQVGATPALDFTIENTGTDVLTVENLFSDEAAFTLDAPTDLSIAPGASQTVNVTFAPTAIQAYTTDLTLTNNAGDDQVVTLSGSGIAAPSLTVDPLTFEAELVAGETTTFLVNIGNVGEAPLDYTVNTSGNNTGFDLTFTTDNWSNEFSWVLIDGDGNEVQSSEGIGYLAFTTYTELLTGLSTDENYTLLFFDSFSDGSLTDYSVTDLGSGAVVAAGDFLESVPQITVPIGSPSEALLEVTPDTGTLAVDESGQLSIFADSEGLSTGTYNYVVTLLTNDPLQPNVEISVTLFIIAPVDVDFSASPTTVCGNLPVQFTDETANVATSWDWDFGDGTTSTEQNPSHQYTADGSYTVTLTACNSLGCQTVTKENYISVEVDCYTQNIPPEHQTEIITVCTGNVYDSGGPTGDYLEGNFGTLIIAPPGATQVSITFSEFNYEEHADFLYIYDGDPSTGTATFLGSYTGNDLAGQTLVAGSGVLVLQEYTGHFTQLSGFVATFSCDNAPQPLTAAFAPNNDVLCTGEARLFTDLSTGEIDTWLWDFGDGTTSVLQNPARVYAASGTYTVSLTVCNDSGCDTEVQEIVIEIDPDCSIEEIPVNDVTYIIDCSGQLFDSGGESGNYFDNNFGATTLIRPGGGISITFTAFDFLPGDMVIIYDGLDVTGDIIAMYTADNPPVLGETTFYDGTAITIGEFTDFTGNAAGFRLEFNCPAFGPDGGTALLIDNSELCDGTRAFRTDPVLGYDSWTWNFGDGNTSTAATPEHSYVAPGMYQVTVEACAAGNCDTYTTMLYSNKLVPTIDAPAQALVGDPVEFHGLTETATHWNWDFGNGETISHDAPTTVYDEPGEYEVQVHLINMNVHETCDATHVHPISITAEPTSVDDIAGVAVRLFPNPTTGRVNLRWDQTQAQATGIRLYDAAGRLVQDLLPVNELDLARLPAGTYVVELLFAQYEPVRQRVVKE